MFLIWLCLAIGVILLIASLVLRRKNEKIWRAFAIIGAALCILLLFGVLVGFLAG